MVGAHHNMGWGTEPQLLVKALPLFVFLSFHLEASKTRKITKKEFYYHIRRARKNFPQQKVVV